MIGKPLTFSTGRSATVRPADGKNALHIRRLVMQPSPPPNTPAYYRRMREIVHAMARYIDVEIDRETLAAAQAQIAAEGRQVEQRPKTAYLLYCCIGADSNADIALLGDAVIDIKLVDQYIKSQQAKAQQSSTPRKRGKPKQNKPKKRKR